MRHTKYPLPTLYRLLPLALFVTAVLSWVPETAQADPLPEMMGYTRPGRNAELPAPKEAAPVAGKDQEAGVGATVYYAVYDRFQGTTTDPWHTELKNISGSFVAGKASDHLSGSRGLDTQARYLYVYQIVNDSNRKSQLKMATIRLLVEPEYITSWGYFALPRAEQDAATRGVSFAVPFTDPAAPMVENRSGVRAVSTANPAVTNKEYRQIAPAYRASQPYKFDLIPVGSLKQAADKKEDAGREPEGVVLLTSHQFAPRTENGLGNGVGGVALVDWSTPPEPLPAPVTGRSGDRFEGRSDGTGFGLYSQLQRTPGQLDGLRSGLAANIPGTGASTMVLRRGREENVYPALQASWLDTPLRPGERSVLFGFTSNLPPTFDGVRLGANSVGEAVPVAGVPDNRPANLIADGTIPTPIGFEAAPEPPGLVRPVSTGGIATPGAAAAPASLVSAGAAPAGGAAGGFGGGPGGFAGGVGGGPSGGFSGGGGLGGFGGFGGGNGGDPGSLPQTSIPQNPDAGNNTQSQTGTQAGTQTVNVNVAQAQGQIQGQVQGQIQGQTQGQTQGPGGNGGEPGVEVIPEPAAILTGILTVPVLFFMARRRKNRRDGAESESVGAV